MKFGIVLVFSLFSLFMTSISSIFHNFILLYFSLVPGRIYRLVPFSPEQSPFFSIDTIGMLTYLHDINNEYEVPRYNENSRCTNTKIQLGKVEQKLLVWFHYQVLKRELLHFSAMYNIYNYAENVCIESLITNISCKPGDHK